MELKEQLEQLDLQKCLMIGLGIAAFYYVLLFNDGRAIDGQIQEIQTQIMSQQEALSKVAKALEDEKKFKAEIADISKNMKDFERYFSDSMTVTDLSEKVSEYAQDNAILVNSLKPVETKAEFANYPETAVELVVEGSFHNIMSFVSQLTKMKKAIDFSKMEFKTVTGGDFPIVKLSTRLIVYSNKEGEQEAGQPNRMKQNGGNPNG